MHTHTHSHTHMRTYIITRWHAHWHINAENLIIYLCILQAINCNIYSYNIVRIHVVNFLDSSVISKMQM